MSFIAKLLRLFPSDEIASPEDQSFLSKSRINYWPINKSLQIRSYKIVRRFLINQLLTDANDGENHSRCLLSHKLYGSESQAARGDLLWPSQNREKATRTDSHAVARRDNLTHRRRPVAKIAERESNCVIFERVARASTVMGPYVEYIRVNVK